MLFYFQPLSVDSHIQVANYRRVSFYTLPQPDYAIPYSCREQIVLVLYKSLRAQIKDIAVMLPKYAATYVFLSTWS